ncbi:MAG: type I methionyl aminopeptidase [Candidatus Omnitrophica bacterium]|jgi:methionyl aminopeptidase|nr:type I methionyl aminopeptidase [Candidatus Omnitrophota bacterium]
MIEGLSNEEIACMRQAGRVAALILKKLGKCVRPGVTTKYIEESFDNYLKEYPGMDSAFKGFMGYPASLCVSINDEVIHGIPSDKREICEGDLVSIDLGIKYKGLFVDTAYTYIAGRAHPSAKKLHKASLKSLYEGIKKAKSQATTGDIGSAVQRFIEKQGFAVVRQFVGHGIGKKLHQYPEVPNFGTPGKGEKLFEGMAIAIEPMVAAGSFDVEVASDGWTAKTKDGSLSAHFEHTIAITKKGPVILTRI